MQQHGSRIPIQACLGFQVSLDDNNIKDTPIDLLHMELFHHFVTYLQGTLAFPQVWPWMLRQSFRVSVSSSGTEPTLPITIWETGAK